MRIEYLSSRCCHIVQEGKGGSKVNDTESACLPAKVISPERPTKVADRITFNHFVDSFESRIRDSVTKPVFPYSVPSASVP